MQILWKILRMAAKTVTGPVDCRLPMKESEQKGTLPKGSPILGMALIISFPFAYKKIRAIEIGLYRKGYKW